MLKKRFPIILCCMASLLFGQQDALYQVSTLGTLVGGVFDGETTLGALSRHGDFGIGTFNAVDGEMLLLDGRFFRIRDTGEATPAGAGEKSPFAAVTFFDADRKTTVDSVMGMDRFYAFIDARLPTPNVFYAVKISGTFKAVRTRSVPKQERPYKPISEIVKTQPVFDFNNVEGVLVGFRCPAYVKGVQFPGFHLHFLTRDARGGGHVLNLVTERVILEIDRKDRFLLELPGDEAFLKADLSADHEADVKRVEK